MAVRVTLPALVVGSVLLAGVGPASAWCVRGVGQGDTLRIRSGPDPRAPEIGRIPSAACGVAIAGACRGAWCPIAWHGRRGWSNAVYLSRGGLLEGVQPPARAYAPPRSAPPAPQRSRNVGPPPGRIAASSPAVPARGTAEQQPRTQAERRQPAAAAAGSLPGTPVREPDRLPAAPPPSPASPDAPTVPPIATAGAAVAPVQAPPPSPPAESRELCVVNIAKGDTLKVRAGPGPDQALRFGFPAAMCGVRITGACKAGWCPIEHRGYRGWAEQRYLK